MCVSNLLGVSGFNQVEPTKLVITQCVLWMTWFPTETWGDTLMLFLAGSNSGGKHFQNACWNIKLRMLPQVLWCPLCATVALFYRLWNEQRHWLRRRWGLGWLPAAWLQERLSFLIAPIGKSRKDLNSWTTWSFNKCLLLGRALKKLKVRGINSSNGSGGSNQLRISQWKTYKIDVFIERHSGGGGHELSPLKGFLD